MSRPGCNTCIRVVKDRGSRVVSSKGVKPAAFKIRHCCQDCEKKRRKNGG